MGFCINGTIIPVFFAYQFWRLLQVNRAQKTLSNYYESSHSTCINYSRIAKIFKENILEMRCEFIKWMFVFLSFRGGFR